MLETSSLTPIPPRMKWKFGHTILPGDRLVCSKHLVWEQHLSLPHAPSFVWSKGGALAKEGGKWRSFSDDDSNYDSDDDDKGRALWVWSFTSFNHKELDHQLIDRNSNTRIINTPANKKYVRYTPSYSHVLRDLCNFCGMRYLTNAPYL